MKDMGVKKSYYKDHERFKPKKEERQNCHRSCETCANQVFYIEKKLYLGPPA